MKHRIIKYLFLSLILLIVSSCDFSTRTTNNVPNHTKENFMIIRYDRLLKDYIDSNSLSALQKMNTTYLPITQVLFEEVLTLGIFTDDSLAYKLKAFYSDPILMQLMNDVSEKFSDLSSYEKELSKGFKELEKNLDGIKIPEIYTQVSALNESIIVTDSLLGISLDKYMGQDYPLYQNYYYDYQTRLMKPEQILYDSFVYYLISEYPLTLYGITLLDVMIYYGKIYYIVDELLGNKGIETVLGYNQEEKKWCKENKSALWGFMLRNRLLQSTDPMLIREYIRPIPTGFYREESPLLLGIWLGYQIVEGYMEQYKKTSWLELLNNNNSVYFLEESKFNPE